LPDNEAMNATLHQIEEAIETLSLPQLIGRNAEDLDWQRLGIENFFQDDSRDDQV
jgi:hypothetical protein